MVPRAEDGGLTTAQRLPVERGARVGRLSLSYPLDWFRRDLSIALGSGALTLDEITRAHAVFPAGGVKVEPHFVDHVVDRDGEVLFDLQKSLDAAPPEQIVDPKVAWVMTQLMVDVARMGTSVEAGKQLKRPSGGTRGGGYSSGRGLSESI